MLLGFHCPLPTQPEGVEGVPRARCLILLNGGRNALALGDTETYLARHLL